MLLKPYVTLVINLNHSNAVRFPDDKATCVLGIGNEAWDRLSLPTPKPKELKTFEAIEGEKHTAVSTRGDLHLRAHNPSLCFDMALEITKVLKSVADCVVDVQGFRYWDGRTIL